LPGSTAAVVAEEWGDRGHCNLGMTFCNFTRAFKAAKEKGWTLPVTIRNRSINGVYKREEIVDGIFNFVCK
jgi:hypothetical protein